jgi:hypothetical protein
MGLHLYEEIEPRFGRIEGMFQRAGWALIAVAVVLALAGVFGGGMLSNATVRHAANGNEIELTYPRLARQETNLSMSLRVTAPTQSASELSVLLSADRLDRLTINAITPQPDTEALTTNGITYRWTVEDWEGAREINFEYEFTDWRAMNGRIEVMAGDESLGSLSFSQFVFP